MSPTSITINWTCTVDVDGYVVYVNDSAVHSLAGHDNTSIVLGGLTPGATYNISVRAYHDILRPLYVTTNASTSTDDGTCKLNEHYQYQT